MNVKSWVRTRWVSFKTSAVDLVHRNYEKACRRLVKFGERLKERQQARRVAKGMEADTLDYRPIYEDKPCEVCSAHVLPHIDPAKLVGGTISISVENPDRLRMAPRACGSWATVKAVHTTPPIQGRRYPVE